MPQAPKGIRRPSRAAAAVLLAAALSGATMGCSALQKKQDDNTRVTGNGGSMLRYSSTQKTVDLTAQQRSALSSLQDHYYPGLSKEAAVAQAGAALRQLQFKPVTEEPVPGLVEGELDTTLVSKEHEILRGVLKKKVPLPNKPDHQSTRALVAVSADTPAGTLVHVELEDTVWDSGGDSKTTSVTAAERYQAFFGKFESAAPLHD